jgi:hypothetical protein
VERRRFRPVLEFLEDRLAPATLTINSVADTIAAGTSLTIREAVLLVDAGGNATTALNRSLTMGEAGQITGTFGSNDTIQFDSSLAGQTITLSITGDDTVGPSALPVTTALSIDGPSGSSGVTLSGGGAASNLRLFYVSPSGNLTLQNLTLSNGRAAGGNGASQEGGGGGGAGLGGAIFTRGILVVQDSTLSGNMAIGGNGGNGGGGGIGGGGGGLGADASGKNGGNPGGGSGGGPGSAGSYGGFGGGGGGGGFKGQGGSGGFGGGGGGSGGSYPGGLSGAARGGFGGGWGETAGSVGAPGGGGAGLGGAIFNEGGTVTITNSTLAGNLAQGAVRYPTQTPYFGGGQGFGGAIFNHNGSLRLLDSTLSGNTAADGGRSVYSLADTIVQAATVVVNNTIIGQADTVVTDFVATAVWVYWAGKSATSITSGSGDLIRTQFGFSGTITSTADPLLGPLGNNGGPTPTLALLPGSPALDAGSNAPIPAGVTTDQRGFARTSGGTVDIGAFEVQKPSLSPTSLSNATYGSMYSQTLTATETGGAGGAYTFAVTAGTIPTGLSLATGGTLRGTPSALGSFTFTVTAKDSSGFTASLDFALTIGTATLTASGVNISATAGAPFSGTAATFTNADPFGSAASYTAVITWGDGSSSAGVITGTGSPLTVTGAHTYADPMNETIQVTISHKLGYTTTAMLSDTATVTSLGQGVVHGLTGRISFWNNQKGQALIKSFGSIATGLTLANWLAITFPNLYGTTTGSNKLSGKSNADVAAYFQNLFNLGGTQVQARALATALSVYATTTSLGGNAGVAYGFSVSATGLGARSYNVGKDGAAFGVANNTTRNVYALLLAVNQQAVNGVLYNGNVTLQAQAAALLNALNQAGGN